MAGRNKVVKCTKFVLTLILCCCSFVDGSCASCSQISFNIKDGMQDKVLEDERKLKETAVINDVECFQNCYMDCRCTSFNVCGKTCQLNERNSLLLPNAGRIQRGCTHYDFPSLQYTCKERPSTRPSPCCTTRPSLCFNGGICDVNITDRTRRFFCKCPAGFYGDQCQIKKPMSCLDYWVGPFKPSSGEHTIEDRYGNAYKVFCDFDSEDGVAWTLIESFSKGNEQNIRSYPLTLDRPINEHNLNWELYRLPKSLMEDIRSRSKYWRGTCSFAHYPVDYRDYIRMRLSELDPTVFTTTTQRCFLTDFIDVKGRSCVNCTIPIFQKTYHLHIAPFPVNLCSLDSNVPHKCAGINEYARLLCAYINCVDPSHRCSEKTSSTTQIWFGGLKPI